MEPKMDMYYVHAYVFRRFGVVDEREALSSLLLYAVADKRS